MGKYEEKSTNEILIEMKTLEMKYEALKTKMLRDYDEFEAIEKDFIEANKEVNKRLKR